MTLDVNKIINSEYAISYSDGNIFFDILKKSDLINLKIDFKNIKHLSTAFLNESIGKLALNNQSDLKSITFIFPKDDFIFKAKVNDVIENALLGDEYDILIDNAIHSL